MGALPNPPRRVAPEVKVIEETRVGDLLRRKILYRSDAEHWTPAYIFLPPLKAGMKRPAILCLHQTTPLGKDEPAGLGKNADMQYGLDLAQRGFITFLPDYPSFGEHKFDFDPKRGYASGSMKAVWDNIRAIDLLETLPQVDAGRIGVIGHSLGGHNAMFTAAFEPRVRVIVSSCGFTSLRRDDLPSWTGKVYMPRIKTLFENDIRKLPFDFHEIVASFAPRPFLACAAEKDDDFDVVGVREVMDAARMIYRLHGAEDRLEAYYPAGGHGFPSDARKKAFAFLEKYLELER
jgi:dienelactone hydrolase